MLATADAGDVLSRTSALDLRLFFRWAPLANLAQPPKSADPVRRELISDLPNPGDSAELVACDREPDAEIQPKHGARHEDSGIVPPTEGSEQA